MIEWFVGVDWGSENHQACIIDGDGNVDGARPPGLVGAGGVRGVGRTGHGGDRLVSSANCRC